MDQRHLTASVRNGILQATAIVALVFAVGFAGWLWIEAERARVNARRAADNAALAAEWEREKQAAIDKAISETR